MPRSDHLSAPGCLSLMLFFLEEKGGPGVDKKEIAIDDGIW